MNSKFKVGEIVHVKDKAWSKILNDPHKPDRHIYSIRHGVIRKFEILAVNACIPIERNNAYVNTLILERETGEIIAINDCNIFKEPEIEIRFFSEGSDITNILSAESRQNLLNSAGSQKFKLKII